jgi:hypothetical protein
MYSHYFFFLIVFEVCLLRENGSKFQPCPNGLQRIWSWTLTLYLAHGLMPVSDSDQMSLWLLSDLCQVYDCSPGEQ